jgi:hypothetical protein
VLSGCLLGVLNYWGDYGGGRQPKWWFRSLGSWHGRNLWVKGRGPSRAGDGRRILPLIWDAKYRKHALIQIIGPITETIQDAALDTVLSYVTCRIGHSVLIWQAHTR